MDSATKLFNILFTSILFLRFSDAGVLNLTYVVIHLDFRGTPPNLIYLIDLLVEFKQLGANALLLEYDDNFPFESSLEDLRGQNAYSKEELIDFLTVAADEGFEIIPLVHTFGNLEYVLKHEEYRNFSESKAFDSICPSKDDGVLLIEQIFGQVVRFHNKIQPLKFLHIGCGEVTHINECIYCRLRQLKTVQIFDRHLGKVCGFAYDLNRNIQVLMWDDMFRKNISFPVETIQPVIKNITDGMPMAPILKKYQIYFKGIWAASPFKGVDGEKAIFPDINERYLKHYNLLKYMHELVLEENIQFAGIILTGLSKYSYGAPFCELFTSALPSLYISLLMVQAFENNIYNLNDLGKVQESKVKSYILPRAKEKLICNFKDDKIDQRFFTTCNYSGAEINKNLIKYQEEFDARHETENIAQRLLLEMSSYYSRKVGIQYINQKTRFMVAQYRKTLTTPRRTPRTRPRKNWDRKKTGWYPAF